MHSTKPHDSRIKRRVATRLVRRTPQTQESTSRDALKPFKPRRTKPSLLTLRSSSKYARQSVSAARRPDSRLRAKHGEGGGGGTRRGPVGTSRERCCRFAAQVSLTHGSAPLCAVWPLLLRLLLCAAGSMSSLEPNPCCCYPARHGAVRHHGRQHGPAQPLHGDSLEAATNSSARFQPGWKLKACTWQPRRPACLAPALQLRWLPLQSTRLSSARLPPSRPGSSWQGPLAHGC